MIPLNINIASSNYVINSLSVSKIVTINDIQGSFPLPPLIHSEDMFLRTFQNGGPAYNYSNNKGSLITTNFNSVAGIGTKNSIATGISKKIVINKLPPLNVFGTTLPTGVYKFYGGERRIVKNTFQINNDSNVTFAQFGDTYIPPS